MFLIDALGNPPERFCLPEIVKPEYDNRMNLYHAMIEETNICPTKTIINSAHRFGSFSQNALVYKILGSRGSYIMKTTPLTNTSKTEVKFVNYFSNAVLDGTNDHFPLCYNIITCRGVGYRNNTHLYRKFMDDQTEENYSAIYRFLTHYSDLETEKPDTLNRLLNKGKLNQAWKLLSPKISDDHLYKYFIEDGRGEDFQSVVYQMEMADMDLRMFLQDKIGNMDLLKQICSVLRFIYENGYHHNDVHPGNILLMNTSSQPFVLLWDFEKMSEANPNIQLFDLISLCNSFREGSLSWTEPVSEFMERILRGELTTWQEVEVMF